MNLINLTENSEKCIIIKNPIPVNKMKRTAANVLIPVIGIDRALITVYDNEYPCRYGGMKSLSLGWRDE
jgi:hypothetical protein